MPAERPDLEFAKKMASKKSRPARKGEPLLSLMVGVLSTTLALIGVMALCGLGPVSMPGLVVQGTRVIFPPNPATYYPGKFAPGWWYVPELGFWVLVFLGILLAAIGIITSKSRGRPILSIICFAVHAILLVAAYFLALTNG